MREYSNLLDTNYYLENNKEGGSMQAANSTPLEWDSSYQHQAL